MRIIMKNHVSSLKKGLDVLKCFNPETDALSAKDISKGLCVPTSTIYRYLDTLLDSGFLRKDSDNTKYRLGYRLLRLGDYVSQGMDFVETARPFLNELSDRCEETTLLMVLSGRRSLCLAKKETKRLIRLSPQIGLTLPLYAGASSKVLLAFQLPSFINEYLSSTKIKKMTPFTTLSTTALRKELEQIRTDRYSICDQDVSPGLAGIAAPVFDAKGNVVSSLVVAGPSERILQNRAAIIAQLKKLCAKASDALGYREARMEEPLTKGGEE